MRPIKKLPKNLPVGTSTGRKIKKGKLAFLSDSKQENANG